jgi:hypothetical protein
MNAMFKTWRSILLVFVFVPGLVAQTQQPPPANKESLMRVARARLAAEW